MKRGMVALVMSAAVGLAASGGFAQPQPKLGEALKKAVKEGPLDLNAASAEEIEALPGVGKPLAKRIVDGRPFVKPEDLVSKKIMSAEAFEKLKHLVHVKP